MHSYHHADIPIHNFQVEDAIKYGVEAAIVFFATMRLATVVLMATVVGSVITCGVSSILVLVTVRAVVLTLINLHHRR